MNHAGIGKTTLAHHICVKWARDGFLAEDFDAIILIPMRAAQQRSLKDVIKTHVGKENYQQIKKSAGRRCLIILEGLDEMSVDCRQNDTFLVRLIEKCNKLEEAVVMITSRPHACEEVDAGRRIAIVGFGKNEIRQFAEKYFSKESHCVEEFLRQLDEYPQLHSLCYVPLHLVMVVDIFCCNEKRLPSTLTKLCQLFIVMTLKREVTKYNIAKKSVAVKAAATTAKETTLCEMLRGIPKETVGIVMCLSELAYHSFFKWHHDREGIYEPRILFTMSDLIQCGIETTNEFDGFGLLNSMIVHQIAFDHVTFTFSHISVQEFLCSVHTCLLPEQEKLLCVNKLVHYDRLWEFCSDLAPSMFTNCMLHSYLSIYNL